MFLAVGLLTAGCSSVGYTSKGAYLGALHDVELGMQSIGFQPVASGHETVSENYALDDDWSSDWVTYDTRRFTDSLGYTAAYSVAYHAYKDGMRFVEVAGCEVSHPDDYALVCGDDGVVQRLNNVPVDKKDEGSISAIGAMLFVGSCLVIPSLLVLLLLI